jgi:hypothetical protein
LINGGSKQAPGVPVRKTRLEFDGGDPVEIELSDAADWQFHALPPRATRKVRLVVVSVYRPQDSQAAPCLAEIWCAHQGWSGSYLRTILRSDAQRNLA